MLTRCTPRLANSLTMDRRGVASPCDGGGFCSVAAWLSAVISGLLLLQHQLRGNEVKQRKTHKDQHIKPQIGKAERLVEGPDADRLEPGRGKCQADKPALTGQGGHGHEETGKIYRWNDGQN